MGIFGHTYANDPFEQARDRDVADSYKSFNELKLEGDPWYLAEREAERQDWMTTGERKVAGWRYFYGDEALDNMFSHVSASPPEPERPPSVPVARASKNLPAGTR